MNFFCILILSHALLHYESRLDGYEALRNEISTKKNMIESFKCNGPELECDQSLLIMHYDLDQYLRKSFKSRVCAETGREQCLSLVTTEMVQHDLRSTLFLEKFLYTHGWPSGGASDCKIEIAAWYLAQHSRVYDAVTMETRWHHSMIKGILPNVKISKDNGCLTPWHYASTYDRYNLRTGMKQVYGTQFVCKNGKFAYREPVEYENLAESRESIGLNNDSGSSLLGSGC